MREETFFAFYNLWDSRYGKADIRASRERADSLVALVNRSYHRDFRISALYADGSTAFWEGRFSHALQSLETAVDLSDAAGVGPEASLSVREAQDYRLWTLWFLGRYRSTIRLAERLLDRDRTAAVNRKKGHLLTFSMVLYRYLGMPERVLAIADDLAQAIRTMKVPGWSGSERGFRGWAQVMTGDTKGLSLVLEGLALARKYHRIAENKYLPLLAECWLHLKEPRKAAGVALSGLRFSEKSGAAYCDAELWRLLGEARRQERKRKEAEACFLRALEISRQQGARALELRATISLGELLLSHSELKRAHEMLLPGISRLQNVMDETDPNLPDMNQAREILNILTL
jgi:tetratricopeptide (TPR) repeat protein